MQLTEQQGATLVEVGGINQKTSARDVLRTATHEHHERLHRHPALARLATGVINKDEYRDVLASFYGFYATAEPLLGFDGGQTNSLVLDLFELGLTTVEISQLPLCPPLARLHGHAEIIGARYVLFGASLGGKAIARALATHMTGTAPLPIRFLTGAGAGNWSVFVAALDANLPDGPARDRAAAAAISVFTAYEQWISA